MKFNFSHRWWLLKRRLAPPEEIAGIDIGDSFARLALLDPDTLNVITAAEIPLSPGAVVGGKIKSSANLASALTALRKKAGPAFDVHPVAILSLQPALFFSHVLELPDIPESAFEEAARLNATQLSPIRLQDAYFDWQNLGVNLETFAREIYIAVASKADINAYLDAAKRAGIDVIAVEPSSLGLIRILTYFVTAADKRQPYLLIYVSSDSVDFVVVKEGKPLFTHFFFWRDMPEIKDGKITVKDFEGMTRQGILKVATFFTTRHKESVSNAVIFSPIFQNELAAMLRDEFQMKVFGYRFPVYGNGPLPETWVGALGAALRGIISRSEDVIVSTMPFGTEELFRKRQIRTFVSFWCRTYALMLLFLIMIFAGLLGLSLNLRKDFLKNVEIQRKSDIARETERLRAEALEFNTLASGALKAQIEQELWLEELAVISRVSGPSTMYRNIAILGETRGVTIHALSTSRQEVLAFKDRLEKTGAFENVDLPLGSIFDTLSGVSFTLTATFKPRYGS